MAILYRMQKVNLDNALQHSIDHILTTFFKAGLLSYFCLAIIRMSQDTLIQYLEVAIICKKKDANGNQVILNVYPTMTVDKKKIEKQITSNNKLKEIYVFIVKNIAIWRISGFGALTIQITISRTKQKQ